MMARLVPYQRTLSKSSNCLDISDSETIGPLDNVISPYRSHERQPSKISRAIDISDNSFRHQKLGGGGLNGATSLLNLLGGSNQNQAGDRSLMTGGAKKKMSGWYSLAGYLQMKLIGGALTYLKPRKRYYFVLDEVDCQLAYFKDEDEFIKQKDPVGQIDLRQCAVTLSEHNRKSFVINATGSRQYELEAENDQSALVWLNSLQHRKERRPNACLSGVDMYREEADEEASDQLTGIGSRRYSTCSLPSDSEIASNLESAFVSRQSSLKTPSTSQRERYASGKHEAFNKNVNWAKTRLGASQNDAINYMNADDELSPPMVPQQQMMSASYHAGVDPDLSLRQRQQNARFQKQCTFYFPGTPTDSGSLVDEEDMDMDDLESASAVIPRSTIPNRRRATLVAEQDESTSEVAAANSAAGAAATGENLQLWIRNWLSDQPMATSVAKQEEGPPKALLGQQPQTTIERPPQQHSFSVAASATLGAGHFDASNGIEDIGGSVLTLDEQIHKEMMSNGPSNIFSSYATMAELRGLKSQHDLEQKGEIQQLKQRVRDLELELAAAQKCSKNPQAHTKYLQTQNKFLNAEILRLSTQWQDDKGQYSVLTRRVSDLEAELDSFKQQYVYLLQSCIRIPIAERHPIDGMEVRLFGGDTHKTRVRQLLEEARQVDPTLPTFDSLTSGGYHVDAYGFRHYFTDESLALHYICTQLHQHYQSQLATQQQHKHRWKLYLTRAKNILVNTKETRMLVRKGIPPSYRSAVWRCLIHQQVVDFKCKFGKYYYRNLCSSQAASDIEFATIHQKQITLDLLRTMPNNVHFSSPTCKGINQLQQVLRAFCLHNPTIGYCQGMNFVAATCLLFLSPEDTFWFLVALTERYFVPSYFDSALTGAQADQEVLKELMAHKLPHLTEHLEKCDIDLATVTLNWFMALFFDALPFQTMLRAWDCFLLEGPKVVFRFALALLALHQNAIMERSDTISVMKIIKAAARLTYDTDGLIKIAFEGLKPFPKRQSLVNKQTLYLKVLKERLRQRQEVREAMITSTGNGSVEKSPTAPNQLPIGDATFCVGASVGLVAFGHRDCGKVALIDVDKSTLTAQELEFDCRIVALALCNPEMAFVSLISGYLVALCIEDNCCSQSWELKLADVCMHLLYHQGRIYAGLANGSLAVIENAIDKSPQELELYYIPVGPAPLANLAIVGGDQYLWAAMGSKAVIVSIKTLDCVEQVYVAGSPTGGCVSYFEKILRFQPSSYGVWLTTAHSSLLQLWDGHVFTCRLLFDISADHNNNGDEKHGPPSSRTHHQRNFPAAEASDVEVQITALLSHENTVWVGTGDGYLMVYEVVKKPNAQQQVHLGQTQPSSPLVNRHAQAARHSSGQSSSSQHSARISTNGNYITGKSPSSTATCDNKQLETPISNDDSFSSSRTTSTATTSANGGVIQRDSGYSEGGSSLTSNAGEHSGAKRKDAEASLTTTGLGGRAGAAATKLHQRRERQRQKEELCRTRSAANLNTARYLVEERKARLRRNRTINGEDEEALDGSTTSLVERSGCYTRGPLQRTNSEMVLYSHRGSTAAYEPLPQLRKFSCSVKPTSGATASTTSQPDLVNRKASTISQSLPWGRRENAENEAGSPKKKTSIFERIRSATSFGSLYSATTGYDYDDYFLMYADMDTSGRTASSTTAARSPNIATRGGLCSDTLGRSESVWSLGTGGGQQGPILVEAGAASLSPWSMDQYLHGAKPSSCTPSMQLSNDYLDQVKLRRKDLQFDDLESLCQWRSSSPRSGDSVIERYNPDGPPCGVAMIPSGGTATLDLYSGGGASETASVLSIGSSTVAEPPFGFTLSMQMKMKIADSPVSSLTLSRSGEKDQATIISCAGNYGDEESVLKWTREEISGLWINDPVVDEAVLLQRRKTTLTISSVGKRSSTLSLKSQTTNSS